MFRAPDTSKARHRKESGGWDSPSQKQKVATWFKDRGVPQPATPAECWETITNTLLGELSDSVETQDNLKKGPLR